MFVISRCHFSSAISRLLSLLECSEILPAEVVLGQNKSLYSHLGNAICSAQLIKMILSTRTKLMKTFRFSAGTVTLYAKHLQATVVVN